MAAVIDYKAIFSFIKGIIKAPKLTAEEKLQIIEEAIDATLEGK